MFDIAPTELLLVAVVALIVIGPKDLPRAMRFVGQWIAKARGVARHFRTGIDEMIRQAELEEMEKKWAAENERIMREHAAQPASDQPIEGEMIPLGGPPDTAASAEGGRAPSAGAAAAEPAAQPVSPKALPNQPSP